MHDLSMEFATENQYFEKRYFYVLLLAHFLLF